MSKYMKELDGGNESSDNDEGDDEYKVPDNEIFDPHEHIEEDGGEERKVSERMLVDDDFFNGDAPVLDVGDVHNL